MKKGYHKTVELLLKYGAKVEEEEDPFLPGHTYAGFLPGHTQRRVMN
jgi:hypothetical protein